MSDNKKFSLDLKNSSLEEALDYVALLTHTFWKPVSANAIFVTQESVAKRRDYEDQVTRVFYLANITSPPELQEVMTAVRTVSNFRLIFPVNSQNALVVRGTRDQVDLAEKIILDLDKPKPEVLVDLLIIEVNKDISRQLAASIASGGTAGLSSTITSTPATTTTTGTGSGAASTAGVLLSQIGHLGSNSWSVTMPGGMIQAMMADMRGRILTAPQLRGVEGQKASLKIGERYPYASGSFQSGVGTTRRICPTRRRSFSSPISASTWRLRRASTAPTRSRCRWTWRSPRSPRPSISAACRSRSSASARSVTSSV